ncbi:MAG: hypothetical protein ABSG51_11705, partial [Terracidiphilus sp.]
MRKHGLQLLAFAVLLGGTLHAQDIAATWQGTFHADGEDRRIVVRIAKSDSGAWTAPVCFIEFVHDWVHVDSFAVHGSSVEFTVNPGKGAFDATIGTDGNSISGAWKWNNESSRLELHRATKETAWTTPFHYQYHMRNVTYARPSPQEPKIPFSQRLAVDYMEQGAAAWTGDWKCVAYHT